MPTCQNCGARWSFTKTFKIPFSIRAEKICPYCSKAQYVTSKTRQRTLLLTIFVIIFIVFMNIYYKFSFVNLLIAAGVIPLYMVLYPFLVELSNERDSA